MKKSISILLVALMLFGLTSCTLIIQPPAPTDASGSAPAATDPVDKQAYYDKMFADKAVKYAGDGIRMTSEGKESGYEQRFENAGDNSLSGMFEVSTGYGYIAYTVNGAQYLYAKHAKEDGNGFVEEMVTSPDADNSFSNQKPNLDLTSDEMKYTIQYVETKDGMDHVSYVESEENTTIDLWFNADGQITRAEIPEEGEKLILEFYQVDAISLPGNIEAKTVTADEYSAFAFACLLMFMPTE